MRRGSASIVANPVLVGAVTTLVVVVAVFLSYNANNGLPFVPTYSLKVNVPSAAQLVKGNEVRVGGTRVGVIDDIVPVNHKDGSVTAQLSLKLDTTIKPLPVDSTVLVRPRSALGEHHAFACVDESEARSASASVDRQAGARLDGARDTAIPRALGRRRELHGVHAGTGQRRSR